MSAPTARNMRLLAQHPLDGFGNCGEGMAIQLTRDGRRVLWLAHESAPKNVTAVDVTESAQAVGPRADRPAARADALELARPGRRPAGRRLPDAGARPHAGRLRDLRRGGSGQAALDRLLRRLRPGLARRPPPVVRGRRVRPHGGRRRRLHAAQSARTTSATASSTCASPRARRRSGAGGCPARAMAMPSRRRRGIRCSTPAIRAHNTNVYPKRPDRAWVGYLDGGAIILDIADKAHPRLVARWDYQPPFPGFTHTLLPLLDRGLLVVSDESIADGGQGLAQAGVDRGRPRRDEPRADQHLPAATGQDLRQARRALRRAQPAREPSGAGLVDLGDDHRRHLLQRRRARLRHLGPVPAARGRVRRCRRRRASRGRRRIQLNDVFVDERQIVYTVDRMIGGLYIYEMKL